MTESSSLAEVRAHFAVSPAKVFAAFADAALVARWLKPAPEITLTVLEFDFRAGGKYRFAYDLPDGPTVIIGGAFRLIERPTRIIFSWIIEPPDEHADIESEVTVVIAPAVGGANLSIRHAKLGRADAIERHQGGWIGAISLLQGLLSEESALDGR
jgi:uncharacterized protein YndB with AHSA1/START domain